MLSEERRHCRVQLDAQVSKNGLLRVVTRVKGRHALVHFITTALLISVESGQVKLRATRDVRWPQILVRSIHDLDGGVVCVPWRFF